MNRKEYSKVTECEFTAMCPLFAKFELEGLSNFWIAFYCKGDRKEECERRKLRKAGKEVPITLLPNGTHLECLKEE